MKKLDPEKHIKENYEWFKRCCLNEISIMNEYGYDDLLSHFAAKDYGIAFGLASAYADLTGDNSLFDDICRTDMKVYEYQYYTDNDERK